MRIFKTLCNHRKRNRSYCNNISTVGAYWWLNYNVCVCVFIYFAGVGLSRNVSGLSLECGNISSYALSNTSSPLDKEGLVLNISHEALDTTFGFLPNFKYTVHMSLPPNTSLAKIQVQSSEDTGHITLPALSSYLAEEICNDSVIIQNVTDESDVNLYWTSPPTVQAECVLFLLHVCTTEREDNCTRYTKRFCPRKGCYRVIDREGVEPYVAALIEPCTYILSDITKVKLQVELHQTMNTAAENNSQIFNWCDIYIGATESNLKRVTNNTLCTYIINSSDFMNNSMSFPRTSHLKQNMSFMSNDSYLILRFKQITAVDMTQYTATFYSIDFRETGTNGDNCRSTYYYSLNATIQGFNHPYQYSSNIECQTILIFVPRDYRIIMYIVYINIPSSVDNASSCLDNYLEISEGDIVRNRLCGVIFANKGLTFRSSFNRIALTFHNSNITSLETAYKVSYHSVLSCSSMMTYTHVNGTIQSVNYPSSYLNSQNCTTVIKCSKPNCVIYLVIDYLDIFTPSYEDLLYGGLTGDNCTGDYVIVHDGYPERPHSNESFLFNTRLCGHWFRQRLFFKSNSSKMLIHFYTDDQDTSGGYVARWISKPAEHECPIGWIAYHKSCYLFVNLSYTWTQAQEYCGRQHHSSLVEIKSIPMHTFMDMQLNMRNFSDYAIWTGANDRSHEGQYLWIDGRQVQFYNWFPGWIIEEEENRTTAQYLSTQPSDDGFSLEDCVELRRQFLIHPKQIKYTDNFYWNDRNCDATNRFICEMALNSAGSAFSEETSEMQQDSCDKEINLYSWHQQAFLSSPHYPHNYNNNVNCTVVITAPVGYNIMIQFSRFSLEEDYPDCRFDSLAITYGDIRLKRICGDWNNKLKMLSHVSRGSSMSLQFVTDHSVTRGGFEISIHLSKATTPCEVGWEYYNETCVLISKNAANYAEAEQHCLWNGAELVDTSTILQLLITSINGSFAAWIPIPVENSTCSVRNIINTTTLYELQLDCADQSQYVCQRQSHGKMHSVVKNTYGSSGSIKTPTVGFYPKSTTITWILEAPSKCNRFFFQIKHGQIEYQEDCLYDSLTIKSNDNNMDMIKLCGNISNKHIDIYGNTAEVTFKSDGNDNLGGFELHWQALDISNLCNRTLTQPNGSISSINFPYSYPLDMVCVSYIVAPENFRIYLVFHKISILSSDDSLTLELGKSEEVINLPGRSVQYFKQEYLSYDNKIMINFKSGETGSKHGYNASYKFVGTSDEDIEYINLPDDASGFIKSVNYPSNYPQPYRKTWNLLVPYGYIIYLEIDKFNQTMCEDTLKFADPHNVTKIMNWCKTSTKFNLTTYLNQLSITLEGFNSSFNVAPVNLRYAVLYDQAIQEKEKSINSTGVVLPECDNNNGTCENGGHCLKLNNGFRCECPPAHKGVFCDKTVCEVTICLNGGSCVNGTGKCECQAPFIGWQCETNITQCADELCTGNGYCKQGQTRIVCLCNNGWIGDQCNIMSFPQTSTAKLSRGIMEEPFWIGIMVIAIVLLITGIVIFIKRKCVKYCQKVKCCCLAEEKKKTYTRNKDNLRDLGNSNSGYSQSAYEYSFNSPTPSVSVLKKIDRIIPAITIQAEADSNCSSSPSKLGATGRSSSGEFLTEVVVENHNNFPTLSSTHSLQVDEDPRHLSLQRSHSDGECNSLGLSGLASLNASPIGSTENLLGVKKKSPLTRQYGVDVVDSDNDILDVSQNIEVVVESDNLYDPLSSSGINNIRRVSSVNDMYQKKSRKSAHLDEAPLTKGSFPNLKKKKSSSQRRKDFAKSVLSSRKFIAADAGCNNSSGGSASIKSGQCSVTSFSSVDSQSVNLVDKCVNCAFERRKSKSLKKSLQYASYHDTYGDTSSRRSSRHESSCSSRKGSMHLTSDYSTGSYQSNSSHHSHRHHHHHHRHHRSRRKHRCRNPHHHHHNHDYNEDEDPESDGNYYERRKTRLPHWQQQGNSSSGYSMSVTDEIASSTRSADSRQSSMCSNYSLGGKYNIKYRPHRNLHRCESYSHSHSLLEPVDIDVANNLHHSHRPLGKQSSCPITGVKSKLTSSTDQATSPLFSSTEFKFPGVNTEQSREVKSHLQIPVLSSCELSPNSISVQTDFPTGIKVNESDQDLRASSSKLNSVETNQQSQEDRNFSPNRSSMDSAYQSIEHGLSKPSSSVVSPTSSIGFFRFKDTDPIWSVLDDPTPSTNNSNEDSRITNQLEMAARKLHVIQDDILKQWCQHQQSESDQSVRARRPESIQLQTFKPKGDAHLKFYLQPGIQVKAPRSLKNRFMFPSRMLSMIKDEEHESDSPTKSPMRLSKASSLDDLQVLQHSSSIDDGSIHILRTRSPSYDDVSGILYSRTSSHNSCKSSSIVSLEDITPQDKFLGSSKVKRFRVQRTRSSDELLSFKRPLTLGDNQEVNNKKSLSFDTYLTSNQEPSLPQKKISSADSNLDSLNGSRNNTFQIKLKQPSSDLIDLPLLPFELDHEFLHSNIIYHKSYSSDPSDTSTIDLDAVSIIVSDNSANSGDNDSNHWQNKIPNLPTLSIDTVNENVTSIVLDKSNEDDDDDDDGDLNFDGLYVADVPEVDSGNYTNSNNSDGESNMLVFPINNSNIDRRYSVV